MNRRFWVTYSHMVGGEVRTSTEFLGKFDTQGAAEAAYEARYSYFQERELRGEGALDAFWLSTKRFAIRSARVALGVVIGLISYGFILDPIPDVLGTPIAGLTLGMIIGAILRFVFGMAFMYAAWFTAFGDAPREA